MATLTKAEIMEHIMKNSVAVGLYTTLEGVRIEGEGSMTTGFVNYQTLVSDAAQLVLDDVGYDLMTDEAALAMTLQNVASYVNDKVGDYIVVYPTI